MKTYLEGQGIEDVKHVLIEGDEPPLYGDCLVVNLVIPEQLNCTPDLITGSVHLNSSAGIHCRHLLQVCTLNSSAV